METKNEEMTVEAPQPSGYRVISVSLLETSFYRTSDLATWDIPDVINEISTSSEPHETSPDGKFAVTLHISYKGLQQEKEICNAEIKMIGVFEQYGEPPLSEEKFKSINAPAIIYPFIREHLHNLCLRSGIANVLLPTVNFKP